MKKSKVKQFKSIEQMGAFEVTPDDLIAQINAQTGGDYGPMVRAALERGAPVVNGKISLARFAAWLIANPEKEIKIK